MLHFREFPLLNTPHLFLVLLKTASSGACGVNDCAARLKKLLQATGENPPFSDEEVADRLRALQAHLIEARLLRPASDGLFEITQRGREALEKRPHGFDTADLMEYPEFAEFVRTRRSTDRPMDPHVAQYDEGFDAYRTGLRPADNPYPAETIDHSAWENGWCEALDEDLS
jgi:hypothetical protein